jgi:hypothetical protein
MLHIVSNRNIKININTQWNHEKYKNTLVIVSYIIDYIVSLAANKKQSSLW